MDDMNMEWLDRKSRINHPFKGFAPINLILPEPIFPNPIFAPELHKKQVSQRESFHSWM